MKNENAEKNKDKNLKDFLLRNIVTVTFSVLVVFGLIMTKDTPLFIMNELVQSFIKYSFLVLAILIPIMAGMGFNFSIVIGAMAGQLAVIAAVNWGFSGFLGFLATAAFATPIALLFGFLSGLLLNKARGHEMITSIFISYVGNGLYQLTVLSLMGVVIPITSSKLLLSSGVGLRNTIDLKDTLLHSVDGVLELSFFFILIITGIVILTLEIYRMKKGDVRFDKKNINSRIVISASIILISFMIMFVAILPNDLNALKTLKFPVITGVIISASVIFHLLITHKKMGRDFLTVALNQKNSKDLDAKASKVRITAIVISTLLASWGQIIYIQNTGYFITYASHMSIGLMAASALIVGGASFRRATVSQALIGLILIQGFLIVTVPVLRDLLSPALSEQLRYIIMNSVLLYAFTRTRSENKVLTVNEYN